MEVNGSKEQTHFQTEQQPISFKAKCPHCSKTFLVRFQDLTEDVSRFICNGCSKDFWISTQQMMDSFDPAVAVVGMARDERVLQKAEPCPKCKSPVLDLNQPCESCGIVPTKFLALQSDSPYLRVGEHIQGLWRRVLNHYDDLGVHHEFLSECLKKNHLRFASLKYKQLKEVAGNDRIIMEMLKKVENLTQMELEKKSQVRESQATSPRMHRFDQFLIAAGVVCIIVGLTSPLLKNWIGVGAVLLSLPLVIRFFLSRT